MVDVYIMKFIHKNCNIKKDKIRQLNNIYMFEYWTRMLITFRERHIRIASF